jgi:hypothetical protein
MGTAHDRFMRDETVPSKFFYFKAFLRPVPEFSLCRREKKSLAAIKLKEFNSTLAFLNQVIPSAALSGRAKLRP